MITGAPFNGALLNFYEGQHEYIGKHSDDVRQLVPGMPIAIVSFGQPRRFRFSPCSKAGGITEEVLLQDGDLLVMAGDTQQTHKHEVRRPTSRGTPPMVRNGRRVSVTLRVFADRFG